MNKATAAFIMKILDFNGYNTKRTAQWISDTFKIKNINLCHDLIMEAKRINKKLYFDKRKDKNKLKYKIDYKKCVVC